MNIVPYLEKIRELIAQGWCQWTNAQDARGGAINHYSKEAVAWCLGGAIRRAGESFPNFDFEDVHQVRFHLEKITGHDNLNYWNDYEARSQAQVIELIDRAIASAKADRSDWII